MICRLSNASFCLAAFHNSGGSSSCIESKKTVECTFNHISIGTKLQSSEMKAFFGRRTHFFMLQRTVADSELFTISLHYQAVSSDGGCLDRSAWLEDGGGGEGDVVGQWLDEWAG